jgi:Uri superfamily endonuclease
MGFRVGLVMDPLVILGGQEQGGVYLLRMSIGATVNLPLGKFSGGRPLTFPAGDYVYIGSALAERGATALAPRLLRHATRSGGRGAHPIREKMESAFAATGLGRPGLTPPTGKRCFWNIDFLLDHPAVELTQVYMVRTRRRLEPVVAQMLLCDEHTRIVAKGVGAHDHPGATHLLGVQAPVAWWETLPTRLAQL